MKDLKTGEQFEIKGRENINKDMPVVVLIARDPLARAALKCYAEIARTHVDEGGVTDEFVDSIDQAVGALDAWAEANESRMPD